MIDIHLLRDDTTNARQRLLDKEPSFDVEQLLKLDAAARAAKAELEQARHGRNELAKRGADGITQHLREQAIELGKRIKRLEKEATAADEAYKKLLLTCPNIPEADLPIGDKSANEPIRVVGSKPTFSCEPRNHSELNEQLAWFDFKAAAAMSGSGYLVYKNDGVKLMYALTQLMLKVNASFGYKPVIPPYLVNRQALVHSGNLPKFDGDYYQTEDGICLIPTAEVSLTNLHAKSITPVDQLPIRYTAWTSCFRKEAGGYGAHERGLIRIHQFEKVELYTVCRPDDAHGEMERMLECATTILDQLGLHYRVSLLATQDCSFASARTFDIEVWMPGQNEYYEVSSISNCTDFQARRAGIRYRVSEATKPQLAYTLNGSSLALPRLMVALIEQYQQEDGSVVLPPVLQEMMDSLW